MLPPPPRPYTHTYLDHAVQFIAIQRPLWLRMPRRMIRVPRMPCMSARRCRLRCILVNTGCMHHIIISSYHHIRYVTFLQETCNTGLKFDLLPNTELEVRPLVPRRRLTASWSPAVTALRRLLTAP